MPTREIDVNGAYVGPHLNKTSVFGNLATLIMLESRATARTLEPTVQASYLTGNLTALMGSRLPSQVNTASDVTTLAQVR